MAKSGVATAAAGGKKRGREQKEEEPKVQKQQQKEEEETSSSSDDSDDDDDSESETENALFRPAPVKQSESDDEEESSSSDSDGEEEPQAPVKEEAPMKKATDKASKKTKKDEAVQDIDANIQEEMDKKTEATVYVEGIPYQADEGDVVSHFSVCGIVKEVRMPRYQDSGRPRGYAHVVFESEKAIPKALELDGKYLFKRYLSVRRAQTPRTLELALKETKTVKKAVVGCKTVFIKQLPYDVEEQTIRDALSNCGTITSIRLPLWNHTKKLKGFGYVEFSKEDEAIAAVKRSGMKVGGRMVIINLDVAGAPKASFRQVDGQYWNKTEEAKKSLAKKLSEKTQRSNSGVANKKRKTTK